MGALLGQPVAAAATSLAAGTITEYSDVGPGQVPLAITNGPDGNMWIANGDIASVTPSGQITQFTNGLSNSYVQGIATGPDGNLWFTDYGASPQIGVMTPAGTVTEYALQGNSDPVSITLGPDGNLWFADQGSPTAIGKVTPSGTVTEYTIASGGTPTGITAGPDGNVWFTQTGPAAIGMITPDGTITEYTQGLATGSAPSAITLGPDGNLWFTSTGSDHDIGQITTAGTITEFPIGATTQADAIAAGPDGNLWFADEGNTRAIGRITTSGTVTEFTTGLQSSNGSIPTGVAAGSDGNIWFTDNGRASDLGMIVTGAPAPVTTPPIVDGQDIFPGASVGCDGEQWATYNGQQPSLAALPWDGYQWLRDGAPIAGQTGALYSVQNSDLNHQLSCRLTGTYPVPRVTVSATSSSRTVSAAPYPPSAFITSPVNGMGYPPGTAIQTSFSCTDGPGGPGISRCTDGQGNSGTTGTVTGTIAAGTVGKHVYTVTATSADGFSTSSSVTYYVVGPPTATISSPATNLYFALRQPASTAFSCAESPGGPGLSSCTDSTGHSGSGTVAGSLDTSAVGAGQKYTVTAISTDGRTSSSTITYSVASPPAVTFALPSAQQVFAKNASVKTSFTCTDGSGGTGIKSCLDSSGSPSGSPLPTGSAGAQKLTVTAVSNDGLTTTVSQPYGVQPAQGDCANGPLTVGVATITAVNPPSGCEFIKQDPYGKTYTTTAALMVNGIPLNAPTGGGSYVITMPDTQYPGGHLGMIGTSTSATVNLGSGLTMSAGAISWDLPAKGASAATLDVGTLQGTLAGLKTTVSDVTLNTDGTAALTLSVTLPDVITQVPVLGPAVTGTAALHTTPEGVDLQGLKIEAQNVYIGVLAVYDVCFEYDQGVNSLTGCNPFDSPLSTINANAQDLLDATCNPPHTAGNTYYSGTLDIGLPLPGQDSQAGLGLFANVTNGTLTGGGVKFSGPPNIELGEGLEIQGANMTFCYTTSPPARCEPSSTRTPHRCDSGGTTTVSLTGGMTFGAAEGFLSLAGQIFFTETLQPGKAPDWKFTIGGAATAVEGLIPLGSGSVTFGTTDIGLGFSEDFSWPGGRPVITATGSLGGDYGFDGSWTVEGEGELNLLYGLADVKGQILMDNQGLAGCGSLTSTVTTDLYIDSNGNFIWNSNGAYSSTSSVSIGGDFDWATKKFTFGCDFARFANSPVHFGLKDARPAQAGGTFEVAKGTAATIVRVTGAGGAPLVNLSGPHGTVVPPPANGSTQHFANGDAVNADSSTGVTTFVLVHPPAGTWSVVPAPGSPPVSAVATSASQQPPSVVGRATSLGNGRIRLEAGELLAPNETLSLFVSGPGAPVQQLGPARGGACRGLGRRPADVSYTPRCLTRTFSLAFGRNGRRTIYGIVKRNGFAERLIKLATVVVKFDPPRAPRVHVARHGRRATVGWSPVRYARRYVVGITQQHGASTSITTSKQHVTVGVGSQPFSVTVWPVLKDGSLGPRGEMGVDGCVAVSGRIAGDRLGALSLGMTLARAERSMPASAATRTAHAARFCVTQGVITAHIASRRTLRFLPSRERGALSRGVVAITTTNGSYSVNGVRVGTPELLARHALARFRAVHVGRTVWYLDAAGGARTIVAIKRGYVTELGVVDHRLAGSTRAARKALSTILGPAA